MSRTRCDLGVISDQCASHPFSESVLVCVACLPVAVSVRVQLERERAYVERGWRQNGRPKLADRDGSGRGGSTETHEHGKRARDG